MTHNRKHVFFGFTRREKQAAIFISPPAPALALSKNKPKPQGTRFRQWANKILQNYMLRGFALNQERLKAQARRLEELRQTVEYLSVKIEEGYQAQDLLFIIRRYVRALDPVNQFDEGRLEPPQKKERQKKALLS